MSILYLNYWDFELTCSPNFHEGRHSMQQQVLHYQFLQFTWDMNIYITLEVVNIIICIVITLQLFSLAARGSVNVNLKTFNCRVIAKFDMGNHGMAAGCS
jgi:hypothetical protein